MFFEMVNKRVEKIEYLKQKDELIIKSIKYSTANIKIVR